MATQTIDLNNVTSVIVEDTTSQIVYPNISEIYLNSEKIWPTATINYFKIERDSDFELQLTHYYDGSVEYSLDDGLTWTTCSASSGQTDRIQTTNKNVMLRGRQNTTFYSNNNTSNSFYLSPQNAPTTIFSGDMETLLDYQSVLSDQHPTMGTSAFCRMCYSVKVTDASQLILPTKISEGCFASMFNSCASLVTPPALPATDLRPSCYASMFYGCTALASAPALPAPRVYANSYQKMFYGCTALTTPPALPATIGSSYCYDSMFQNCSALNTLPKIYLTDYKTYYCRRMFQNCSNIKLSTTQDTTYTTEYRIPALGTATTSGTNWNTDMFKNTGGTFTSNPSANTTYYTSNQVI